MALLAYLTVAAPRTFHRRDTLLALFWPELDATRARNSLNQSLHFLRRTLRNDVIVSRGADEVGVADGVLQCDVLDFEAALARGAREDAIALYRGSFMSGFFLPDLVELERWVDNERARLAALAAEAAWTLADRAADDAQAAVALDWARRAFSISNEEEHATRRLIALRDRIGDRQGAIREYEAFARRLEAEYEAKPSPETQALIDIIRRRSGARIDIVAAHETPLAPAALSTPSAAAAPLVRRRHIGVALLAGLAVLIAAGTFATVSYSTSARDTALDSTIAVFPFAYHGDPAAAYTGDGVSTLVSAELDGGGGRSVDYRTVAGLARDSAANTPAQASAIAARLAAGMFVLGDVTESGGRIRVTASLRRARSPSTSLAQVTGEGEAGRLLDVADEVAARLLAEWRGGRARLDRGAAALHTHSVAALKLYLDGEASYRGGRYPDAVDALRRAVALDSTFALALFRLSNAANWTGDFGVAGWAARQARLHGDRLSSHDRRAVQAWNDYLAGRTDAAEQVYRAMLAVDSADAESWYHLADIHFHYGAVIGYPPLESAREWERAIALDPGNASALLHYARVLAAQQRRQEFEAVVQRLAPLAPDADRVLEIKSLRAFAFGDRAARRAVMNEYSCTSALVCGALTNTMAFASRDLDDVAELTAAAMVGTRDGEPRGLAALVTRTQVELARGQLATARATLDSVRRVNRDYGLEYEASVSIVPLMPASPARWSDLRRELAIPFRPGVHRTGARDFLSAMIALRMGDTGAVARHVAALDAYRAGAGPWDTTYARRWARLVRVEQLRAARKPAEALAVLGPPELTPERQMLNVSMYGLAYERFLRAELLFDLGRMNEALRWFETFPDPWIGDVMYVPAARLRRAEIYERLTQPERAADEYAALLATWRDADPDLAPVVQDVQRRLRRLRPPRE